MTAPRPGGRVFYGWTIVGTVFVILMVTSGLGFYNASVILSAATDELDVSVSAVSGATALFFAVSGITGFVLSRQLERRDLRLFYVGGGIVGAVALAGLRWVDTVALLYVFFALFGIGFALAGLVPGTTLVTRWFNVRRSIALSIASTGLSLGGIAITPVSAWLIDERSLAGAGPILALVWLVGVIPIGVLLIRSRPGEMGLEPDGATPDRRPTDPPRLVAGATFANARRTRFFVMMCVAYALIFFAQVGGLAHLFNVASERADRPTASTALSLLALTSVVGRLAGGVIVLRLSTRALSTTLALFQGLALALLANANAPWAILGASVLLGVSVGNLLMLQPLLLAEAFGVAEYGRIYSFNQLFSTAGVAGGPVVLGLVHDSADYRVAFLVAAAASVAGFVSFLLAGATTRAYAAWDVGTAPRAALLEDP
ncbi:MAG: MFS transporter [Acidimicrobiales bacterium]